MKRYCGVDYGTGPSWSVAVRLDGPPPWSDQDRYTIPIREIAAHRIVGTIWKKFLQAQKNEDRERLKPRRRKYWRRVGDQMLRRLFRYPRTH